MIIHFRDSAESDKSLIYSSWIQSFRELNILKLRTGRYTKENQPQTKDMPTGAALWEQDRYFKHQRDLIDAVLKCSKVIVASNPDDHDHCYGYVVYRDFSPEIRVISYLYIKHTFRKMGVAKALFEKLGECHVVTHSGPGLRKLILRAGLIYDPFFDYGLLKERV